MITRVNEVKWSVNRTGELTPTALFDPVLLDEESGTETDRVCLYDFGTLMDLGIKPGDDVEVVSRGGIPWIERNVNDGSSGGYIQYPAVCPVCGETVDLSDDKKHIFCRNDQCMAVLLPKIERFLSKEAIFIPCLSGNNEKIKSLIENGYIKKAADVVRLGEMKEGLITDCGFSEKECDEISERIEELKHSRFMIAKRTLVGLGLNIGIVSLSNIDDYCRDKGKLFTDLSPDEIEGMVNDLEYKEIIKWMHDEKNVKEYLEVYKVWVS